MPPPGYLTAAGIESCLQYLANTYPTICQLIVMPEASHEGSSIRAIRIRGGASGNRRGVLFIGGVHAREIVNPDLLVSFALNLCKAYTSGTGLTFGGRSYGSSIVRLLVHTLDIFILPLVNPDGRVYVQSPTGDAFWRKNRNPNVGLPCRGADINRNYNLLWSSGIGTSASSCSEVFKGNNAFSEPETRNVRHLLDTYPNIMGMIDVHSYMQLVLYPWGDDDNQTTNPSMNFMNPAYNGMRGTAGDSIYREYMPQTDWDWFATTGNRVRDAIAAVRGRVYTVEQSILLYPTSGDSKDYAYSRHFVDATKRKVFAYVLETGTEFQPPYSEALNIISEVSSGLVEFCLACLCAFEEVVRSTALEAELEEARDFREHDMLATPAGRRYVRLLTDNSAEVTEVIQRDDEARKRAVELLQRVNEVVASRKDRRPKVFEASLIEEVERYLNEFSDKRSPSLKKAIQEVRRDLKHFRGKTVSEGLESASKEHENQARY